MPHIAWLRTIGRSLLIEIPKAMLDALKLDSCTLVTALRRGRVVVEVKARRDSLDDLLAQHKSSAQLSDQDLDWTAGAAVGRELI